MLEVKNLVKVYKTKGGVETRALDGVTVNFPETGLVFLLGKSGSGKSTLLNMIGGLDKPDDGEIIVKGRSSKNFSQSDFDSYRNTYIGFIFQEYNVLNEFNIEQNIALALQLQGKKNDREAVNALLKEVDLEGFNKRKPNTLSGGQKQRIAIARALIKSPEIIMADEPTGALDSNTGKQVLETLKKLSKDKLVIIVSHDQDFAEEYGDRIIELKDGKIISDKSKEHVPPKEMNANIQVINGNIIDIKKGSDLSEADFKQLYQLIKKQDKEVLISTGENNIAVTKKAQRISEDGKGEVFKDTQEVKVKQYNGAETKFIRSHMPFSRSFKMGASGLKTKPIRLIFTILLSVVSFTMFGIASTLMLYDSAYSLSDALKSVDRTSEAVVKQYDYTSKSITINNKTGEVEREGSEYPGTGNAYFGVQELADLNASQNNRYLGVYTLSGDSFSLSRLAFSFQNVMVNGDAKDYYSFNGFSGLTDASKEQIIQVGAQLTGEHPKAANEVAISNYHFDLLKESGALGTLNEKNSILGKELDLYFYGKNWMSYTVKMKIVGVYDFGNLPSTYDAIKQAKEPSVSQDEREEQVGAFDSFIGTSTYTIGYVAPEFYETYGYVPTDNRTYIDSVWTRGVAGGSSRQSVEDQPVNNDTGFSAVLVENLEGVTSGVTYYDKDFKEVASVTLTDNDVLLPYTQYYSEVLYSKYWRPISDYLSKVANYRQYYSADDNQILADMENWDESAEYTNPLVNAFHRLRDVFNKGGENVYPAGHTMDEDFETVVAGLDGFYAKASARYYLCDAYNDLNNYYLNNSIEPPTNWSEDNDIVNKLGNYEESATDAEILTLKNDLSDAFEAQGAAAEYILKTVRADVIFSLTNDNYRTQVEDKAQELYGKEYSIYDIIGNYKWDHEDVEKAERFDTIYNYAYKLLKGEEAPITFEYNPDFLGAYVQEEIVVEEPQFFTKDMSGTIKEYNVKGYVNITSNNWAMVFTRNAIKDFLEDSYSWKSVYTTSYEAPADAKYAYVIATNAHYSEADISAFTAKHETYFYEMTNSVYQMVSRSTKMIEELKTVFLIIGAVTGGLAGLLLLNFISVSISSKNKDIGILRAVGARGSDVFKIFFSESSIITLICFVLSAVAAGFVCNYLNQQLSESMIGVKLLNYGVINIGLILGVALVISFIATFIPVLIASKKPPVEAIRSL